jgi:putative DNA modification/repair radical SAM protein|uniref:putative DNA modification/repair radical SAM protein n=1 Tax=Gemmiger qucibialis TaxID=2997294 RepID=UPI0040270C99
MQLEDKLAILADSAKYDVACTSSGVDRAGVHGKLGCSVAAGICHSFTPDGRCISLLKVLYSNACCYDCGYCVNRRSNDVPRATFTPRELAELTIGFYKRNYIEGLFLSSAVIGTPDYTMERMIEALRILRQEYHFNGYIHAKTIPGADAELVRRIGLLADRLSVNIELPSEASLSLLAPDKKKQAILKPMGQIAVQSAQSKKELVLYRHAPAFAPAGQSTQMIIGATPESDRHIMGLAESLYKKYSLKRVFFSAYLPVNSDSRLPALDVRPPLLREHRLYQADWLLRYYDFSAWELLTEEEPNFDPYLDPKCTWAVRHPEFFPVEINTAPKAALLRIPGIGPKSALRILSARRQQHLGMAELKRMGVVLKRAQYFITCNGCAAAHGTRQEIAAALLDPKAFAVGTQQLSLDDFTPKVLPDAAPAVQKLAAAGMPARQAAYEVKQEALQCLTRRM